MDLPFGRRRSFAIKRASECLTSVKRLLDKERKQRLRNES